MDDVYKLPLQEFQKGNPENLTEAALYGIVEDLCTFILKEVIPAEGKSRRFQYISYARV